MFKREERHGKFIGYSQERGRVFFFFGSRFLPKAALNAYFPDFTFCFLKQVHGNQVVEAAADHVSEADAHHTTRRGLALVSQTADCTPVLLASPNRVCAIHSGWRGTEKNIVAASVAAFSGDLPQAAAIGPHILRQSFEVGRDVAVRLSLASTPQPSQDLILPHADSSKAYFDLTELVRRQLRQACGPDINLLECLEDTVTSVQLHSFRRDRERSERQFSFVVLKA